MMFNLYDWFRGIETEFEKANAYVQDVNIDINSFLTFFPGFKEPEKGMINIAGYFDLIISDETNFNLLYSDAFLRDYNIQLAQTSLPGTDAFRFYFIQLGCKNTKVIS